MMLPLTGILTVLVTAAAPPASSIAILGLTAKTGVTPDVAELLTGKVDASIRRTGVFARVISASDVQATLNFDAQRQLLACDAGSCMAEAAGFLGVDYVVNGTVGGVGDVWVFSLRIINAKSATAAAAVSKTIEGSSQAVLVHAVDGVVDELMAAFKRGAPPPKAAATPAPAVTPEPAPPAAPKPATAATPPPNSTSPPKVPAKATNAAAPAPRVGSPLVLPLRAAGGVGLGITALAIVVGIAAVFVAVGSFAVVLVPYSDYVAPALPWTFISGLAVLAVSGVLGLLAGGGSAAALGASFVVD